MKVLKRSKSFTNGQLPLDKFVNTWLSFNTRF